MLFALGATIGIELGVYVAATVLGADARGAAIATLVSTVVWICVAAPLLSAGASTGMGAVSRGGITVDASAVVLVVLWLTARNPDSSQPLVTFLAVLKIYCALLAVGLAGVAVVACGRSVAGRGILAVAMAVILTVVLAGPFLAGPLLDVGGNTAARAVIYVNPIYSVSSAVAEETGFVWHLAPVLYKVTRIGSYAPAPEVPWYAATVVYGCIAGMAFGVRILSGKGGQDAFPAERE